MFRGTFLVPSHYAGKWLIPDEDQRNDLAAVNALGYAYATAPDSLAKEANLLEVLKCFRGYLINAFRHFVEDCNWPTIHSSKPLGSVESIADASPKSTFQ
jgi:hypothetical protein